MLYHVTNFQYKTDLQNKLPHENTCICRSFNNPLYTNKTKCDIGKQLAVSIQMFDIIHEKITLFFYDWILDWVIFQNIEELYANMYL